MESMSTDSINLASDSSHRLVHLDLKGAPPKLSYYEELIPLLKVLGATGLLIEYEDMFPYEGDFQELPLSYAYSKDEVRRILKLAKINSLIVIPLIQTFGHLEFLLKHERFKPFREVSRYPNSLCPSHPDSVDLIYKMLSQVMEMHKDSLWLHLGGDEVWQMGVCKSCKTRMGEENWCKDNLFLQYILSLAELFKKAYPRVTLIIWDDMIRTIDVDTIKKSGIGNFVEPMVWHYVPLEDFRLDHSLWEKYAEVFPNLWVASAFKGATEMTQVVTPPRYHMLNQMAWVEVLQKYSTIIRNINGIALTGWQRFDHFTVLCELLPQAIPCLAIALQTLHAGCLSEDGHRKVSHLLGFSDLLPIDIFPMPIRLPKLPTFPGAGIYVDCLALAGIVAECQIVVQHPSEWLMRVQFYRDSKKGAFSKYQIMHGHTNPLHIDQFLPKARVLFVNLEAVHQSLHKQLLEIYYPDTVEEWIMTNVAPMLQKMRKIVRNAEEQLVRNADLT